MRWCRSSPANPRLRTPHPHPRGLTVRLWVCALGTQLVQEVAELVGQQLPQQRAQGVRVVAAVRGLPVPPSPRFPGRAARQQRRQYQCARGPTAPRSAGRLGGPARQALGLAVPPPRAVCTSPRTAVERGQQQRQPLNGAAWGGPVGIPLGLVGRCPLHGLGPEHPESELNSGHLRAQGTRRGERGRRKVLCQPAGHSAGKGQQKPAPAGPSPAVSWRKGKRGRGRQPFGGGCDVDMS